MPEIYAGAFSRKRDKLFSFNKKFMNAQPKLENMPVEDVPKDTLFTLTEPITINYGQETIADRGDHLMVADEGNFPSEIRMLIDTMKKDPDLSYYSLHLKVAGIRRVVILILLAKHLEHLYDVQGKATSFGTTPIASGAKQNIVPSPVSAEPVMPATRKVRELPLNQPIVLAADHHQFIINGVTNFNLLDDEEVLPRSKRGGAGAPDLMSFLIDCVCANRGTVFELFYEPDSDRLFMRPYIIKGLLGLNDSEIIQVNPDNKLKVYVPAVQEEDTAARQNA